MKSQVHERMWSNIRSSLFDYSSASMKKSESLLLLLLLSVEHCFALWILIRFLSLTITQFGNFERENNSIRFVLLIRVDNSKQTCRCLTMFRLIYYLLLLPNTQWTSTTIDTIWYQWTKWVSLKLNNSILFKQELLSLALGLYLVS